MRRVRHDVNNPLMGIYGNVELLLSGESLSPTPRDKVGAQGAAGVEAEQVQSPALETGVLTAQHRHRDLCSNRY